MRRLCWVLSAVFAISTLVLAYLFLVQGQTTLAADGRTAILLTAGERNLVLAEMRAFLTAIQEILSATNSDDAVKLSTAARKVGAATQTDVPASLVGKLPLAFKRLGFDTHQRFDQLALDVEQLDDVSVGLAALPELMGNCVACHAAYKLELESVQ